MNMSDSTEFTIAWDPYMRSVVNMFGELKQAGVFLDCTLCSRSGEYIRAHRVIVSACSPYLKTLLMTAPEPNPVLVLSEVNFKQLQYIVAFMYSGCVKVPESDLYSLLEVSRILKVTGLCLSANSVDAMFPQPKEGEDDVNMQLCIFDSSEVQRSSDNDVSLNRNFTCNNNKETTEHDERKHRDKSDVIKMSGVHFDHSRGDKDRTAHKNDKERRPISPVKTPVVQPMSGKVEKRSRGRPRLASKEVPSKVVSPLSEIVRKRVVKKRAIYPGEVSPTRNPKNQQERHLRSVGGSQNLRLFDLDPACPYCRKEFITAVGTERHIKNCYKNPLNSPDPGKPQLESPSTPPNVTGEAPVTKPSTPSAAPTSPTGTPVKSFGQLRCHFCAVVCPKPDALLFHLRTQHNITLLDSRVIGYECSTDTPMYFCAKCSSLDSDTSHHSSGDCLKTPAEINLAKSARVLHGAKPSFR